MGSGTDGILYVIATRMAIATLSIFTGTMASGTGTTIGLGTIGTTTICLRSSQLFSFLFQVYWESFCF